MPPERKGEVASLSWADVDRGAQRITRRAEHSKNGEPRILPLSPELGALIERRWRAREYKAADGTPGISKFVFNRRGQPLGDFRKSRTAACEAARVGGTLFHDMRRSAVRNFDRAGIGQTAAMKITGHQTASVYRRYRIVNEKDIRAALLRTETAAADVSPPATVLPMRKAAAARGFAREQRQNTKSAVVSRALRF